MLGAISPMQQDVHPFTVHACKNERRTPGRFGRVVDFGKWLTGYNREARKLTGDKGFGRLELALLFDEDNAARDLGVGKA